MAACAIIDTSGPSHEHVALTPVCGQVPVAAVLDAG